jgi:predicted enzyme related to lactoylglutathione lyase
MGRFCRVAPRWLSDQGSEWLSWTSYRHPCSRSTTYLMAAVQDVARDAAHHAAHTGDMPLRLHHVVIDAHDLPGLARFWTQALGWKILSEHENEIVIGTDENAPVGICFMPVTGPKTVKNRVHLDLTSSAADRDQQIDRLLALGARRADIGQTGAESWTVLADPEGNEFCVVRPKETLIR